jgi:hypothetical protein
MKSIFFFFLACALTSIDNYSFSQKEIELIDVDSADAHFILNQIDEIISGEQKLVDVAVNFEEFLDLLPDSLRQTLTETDIQEVQSEYDQAWNRSLEAFAETRKYSDAPMHEVVMYKDTFEVDLETIEVEYTLWRNENDGALVDFIYLKSDQGLHLIYAIPY